MSEMTKLIRFETLTGAMACKVMRDAKKIQIETGIDALEVVGLMTFFLRRKTMPDEMGVMVEGGGENGWIVTEPEASHD
jgi:hypothetical protein